TSPALLRPDKASARVPSDIPETTSVQPAISRFGIVNVQLRWSDGAPAAGIAVDFRRHPTVSNAPMRGLMRVVSDEQGRARSEELLPGRVSVLCDRGSSQSIEVVAGEERELVLDIEDGLEVEGRVLDAHDRPVADAQVWLTSIYVDWLGMSAMARSDASGFFRLRDVPQRQS